MSRLSHFNAAPPPEDALAPPDTMEAVASPDRPHKVKTPSGYSVGPMVEKNLRPGPAWIRPAGTDSSRGAPTSATGSSG